MRIYRYLVTVLLTWNTLLIKNLVAYVYYKTSLPLKLLDIKYLQEYINPELIISDNLCSFIILYRSPSQTHDDFVTFMKNLELNFDKIDKKILS